METCFTSLKALHRREPALKSSSSMWMFPIYGLATFFTPLSGMLKNKPLWIRGLIYMCSIFTAEYTTGRLLQSIDACPWDYSRHRFHVRGVIRLDFAPLWFMAGLLFEYITDNRHYQKTDNDT
jgi:uncharacterized membrane protein